MIHLQFLEKNIKNISERSKNQNKTNKIIKQSYLVLFKIDTQVYITVRNKKKLQKVMCYLIFFISSIVVKEIKIRYRFPFVSVFCQNDGFDSMHDLSGEYMDN